MFKTISICAALVVLGTGVVNAQQQEATLRKVDVLGTGFDLVFAMAKPGGAYTDLRGIPDPLVAYAGDGKLAFAIDDNVVEMFKDIGILNAPACTFQLTSGDNKSPQPVSVYVVPKHEAPAAIRMASLKTLQVDTIMRKVEVSGGALDIVFATTKTPVTVNPNDPLDSLAVYSIGSELAMAVDGDVEKMFKDVGDAELPACAFEVEHKGSNPPQAASVYIFPKN